MPRAGLTEARVIDEAAQMADEIGLSRLTLAALVGLILILPALLLTLPASLQDTIVKFLPGNAGQAIFTAGQDTSALSPWAGLAVFAFYAAAALTLALVLLRRRDA